MVFVQGVEMDGVPPNTSAPNLNAFLASSLHNVLLETTILAIKAVVLSLTMIGEVSAWNAAGHDDCISNGGFPIPELYMAKKHEPENKDASDTEGDDDDDDDDDDAINKEVEDGEDDDASGDEGEDDDDDVDPEGGPNANGDGGSDDEDDDDDDDGDEENGDDEGDDEDGDEEEEEEDEEVPQPPAKKRK